MTYIENAVTAKEIAVVTKRTVAEVEAEAAELNVFVGTDWAGRPAVSEVDARQLVSGDARRVRESEAEWSSFLARCATWTLTRDELVREAQRAAELASQRDGHGGGAGATAGVEAERAAGADYETSNPPPTWGDQRDGNARRLFTAEPGDRPGLLDRARDLLAGSPR
ncbi:MAG: hypothetical protein ABI807_05530 [Sporichthyaceae bacterium]